MKFLNKLRTTMAIAALFALAGIAFFAMENATWARVDSSQKVYAEQDAGNLLNSNDTSAANTAIVKTLTGVVGKSIHVYSVDTICSAGASTVTVDDGTSDVFIVPVGTTHERVNWATPLTAPAGATVTVTLATCGAANTGTLSVQADVF